jgi:hypothetical protein
VQVREFSHLTKQRHREPHVACLARSIGGAGATMMPPSGCRANSVAMAERSARGLLVPRFFVTSGGLMTRRCVSDGPGLGKTCNLSEARHARKSYTPKAASPIRTCWPMNVNGWGISLAPQSHLARPRRPAGLFFVVNASRLHEETKKAPGVPGLRVA